MTVKKVSVVPKTLREAHESLVQAMPAPKAPLSEWLAFRRRSAAVYRKVADVDRGHHHEALYWAEREQKAADELAKEIKTEAAHAHDGGER